MIRDRAPHAILAFLLSTVLAAPVDAHLDPVSGACGVLDTELVDASPHLIDTDAGVEECDFVPEGLSPGGLEILLDGGAGGSSIYSEILAHEIALQCEQAVLLKTETEIIYVDPNGKKTDMLVTIDGVKIGISVTRAIVFPPGTPLSPAQAQALLEDKLADILESSANVDSVDAWQKQILTVETPSADDRDVLLATVPLIDAGLRADTIIWVVQTDGEDDFLYFGDPPECDAMGVTEALAVSPSLHAYPNPFRPSTGVAFAVRAEGPVTVEIFDPGGRRVRSLGGEQRLRWDGRADDGRLVGSGVYLVRVTSGEVVSMSRIVLVK